MKTIRFILFLLCLIVIHTTSCEKDKSNVLPDETQEGNNTLGFLLNGKVWTSKVPYCSTTASANKSNLSIGASVSQTNIPYVGFCIKDAPIKTDTVYLLSSIYSFDFGEYGERKSNGDIFQYYTTDEYKGSVTLTKFDTINQIVSGKFSFKAKRRITESSDCYCDTIVTITDGRFDLKYTRIK